MRQLQTEQMRISMSPSMSKRVEVEGKIIKHRALFAGTFARWMTKLRLDANVF